MDWARDSLGLVWVAVAIVAAVVEVFTLDLIFLMVAGGALLAALTAVLTGSLTISIIVFALGSLGLLLGARPALRRYMQRNVPSAPMHTDALVGRIGEVVEPVGTESGGRIRLDGDLWSARLEGGGEPAISAGHAVSVVRIDGATAIVRLAPRLDGTPPGGLSAAGS